MSSTQKSYRNCGLLWRFLLLIIASLICGETVHAQDVTYSGLLGRRYLGAQYYLTDSGPIDSHGFNATLNLPVYFRTSALGVDAIIGYVGEETEFLYSGRSEQLKLTVDAMQIGVRIFSDRWLNQQPYGAVRYLNADLGAKVNGYSLGKLSSDLVAFDVGVEWNLMEEFAAQTEFTFLVDRPSDASRYTTRLLTSLGPRIVLDLGVSVRFDGDVTAAFGGAWAF